jgi:DNA-binding NarL/FixJ family response regulator
MTPSTLGTDTASATSAVIRVAVVDDQSLVREGLRTLLSGMAGIEVVLAAASGVDFLEQLAHTPVDVAIIDIRMPGQSGFEVVRQLHDTHPTVRSILLTTFDEHGLIGEAVRVGAEGLLLKGVSPEQLLATIRAVAKGQIVREPAELDPVHRATHHYSGAAESGVLTARECAILRLAAAGRSNKDIGRALGLVEGTIKNYMREILIKLDARDRTQAVMKALAARLI